MNHRTRAVTSRAALVAAIFGGVSYTTASALAALHIAGWAYLPVAIGWILLYLTVAGITVAVILATVAFAGPTYRWARAGFWPWLTAQKER